MRLNISINSKINNLMKRSTMQMKGKASIKTIDNTKLSSLTQHLKHMLKKKIKLMTVIPNSKY